MMQDHEDMPNLNSNTQDKIALVLKGSAGAIPFAGGIIAEVIGELIPNQRIDRIATFLKILEQRVGKIENTHLKNQLRQEQNIDLFEDACFQAIRALSNERLEYIANVFANSLTQEEVEYLFKKKLMWLLGQLNDNELLMLRAYASPSYTKEGKEFWKKHEAVVRISSPILSATEKEVEKATLKRSFLERLVQLGLITQIYQKPKKGGFPEFDIKTGKIKSKGYKITLLGKTLVRYINDEIEDDQQNGE